MSWQRSIQAAIRALKREENALGKRLGTLQDKIAELENLSRSGPGASATKSTRRRLSPKGRAAISRAAKRRWAQYRAKQRKR